MQIHSRNTQATSTTMPKIRVSGNGMGGAPAVPLNSSTGAPAMPKVTRSGGSLGTDSVGPNIKK